jgi:hypothetical protein
MMPSGQLVPGWWKAITGVPRLRLSGTGTVSIDVRDRDGTITPAFATTLDRQRRQDRLALLRRHPVAARAPSPAMLSRRSSDVCDRHACPGSRTALCRQIRSELSAGQATGAASVMTANADRLAISIMPNANGRLYYTGSGGGRWPLLPLYAGVARTLTGAECPAGDLYVTGQPAARAAHRGGVI